MTAHPYAGGWGAVTVNTSNVTHSQDRTIEAVIFKNDDGGENMYLAFPQ